MKVSKINNHRGTDHPLSIFGVIMTGLFFGSFNPIHKGHLQIAQYLIEHHLTDHILFVVSPQNPFKKAGDLLDAQKRIELVQKAIAGDNHMDASSIEFSLPKPSYTIDTLKQLSKVYPGRRFALVMGEDNLQNFHLWREYETICENYTVFVYPRPGNFIQRIQYPNIHLIDAPLFPVSSTEIREKIRAGEDITPFVPAEIHDLILNYYSKSC